MFPSYADSPLGRRGMYFWNLTKRVQWADWRSNRNLDSHRWKCGGFLGELGRHEPNRVFHQRSLVSRDRYHEPASALHRDVHAGCYWRGVGDGSVHQQCLQFDECGDLDRHRGQSANRLRRLLSALDAATCPANMNAPRGYEAKSLPDTQRPRWYFSGDERAACQGDAVHVSRILAEDAAQLRSFEGSEKQAAQNQTVSGPAAKGACLNPDLTSSPRTGSTSIVQSGCTKPVRCRKRNSSRR